MNDQNYNHFFYFFTVAKFKSVTKAAKHLNTSQSSVSAQIKILESQLGRPLLRKSGRNIELTAYGLEVHSYCRRAFEIFDEMFDQLDKRKSSMGPRVTIGVSNDIERPFVTDALSRVSQDYPDSKRPMINLISLATPQLIQQLKVGEVDILLSTQIRSDNELETLFTLAIPVKAFLTPAIAKRLKARTLAFVLTELAMPAALPSRSTALREEIDRFLERKRLKMNCVFESNTIASVVRAAGDGLGITLLPQAYVDLDIKLRRLTPLNGETLWTHKVSLIARKRRLDEDHLKFVAKLKNSLTLSGGF